MGRKKYLKDSDIEINGIYENTCGNQFIYLGKALWSIKIGDDVMQDNEAYHIYLKVEELDKYPFNMPLMDIFYDVQNSAKLGCYKSKKLKKMINKIRIDERNQAEGSFQTKSFFHSVEIVQNFKFC